MSCRCIGHPLARDYCSFCKNYPTDQPCPITGMFCLDDEDKDQLYWESWKDRYPEKKSPYHYYNIVVGANSFNTGSFNTILISDGEIYGNFNVCIGNITQFNTNHSHFSGNTYKNGESGNICIANEGQPGDYNMIRIGNRRDHKDVYLPNRTHLDVLSFKEFVHDPIKSSETVDLPLNESIVLIPLVDPPLENVNIRFHTATAGDTMHIIFYSEKPSDILIKNISLVGSVIDFGIKSIDATTQGTAWYFSKHVKKWIRFS